MLKIKENQPRGSLLSRNTPYFILATIIVLVGLIMIVAWIYLSCFRIKSGTKPNPFVPTQVSSGATSVSNHSSQNPPAPTDIFSGLTQSSFSDIFSGFGWLNSAETDMYQDRLEMAFIFSPIITWKKLDSKQIPKGGWLEKKPDGRVTRCINNRCLVARDSELTFQGNSLSLPVDFAEKEIVNISIGNLDTLWLLGIVTKESGQYRGWVFSFNGSSFKKIFGDDGPFRSSYLGTLGFGGSDSDWLAIYGGYEGIAYRVRSGLPTKNISNFFGIRVMGNGFAPAVLRISSTDRGARLNPVWYIFSLTSGQPRLIKLFQNDTNEIQGAVGLFPIIDPLQNASAAVFGINQVTAETVSLMAKITGGDGGVWRIDDQGFKKDKEYEVVSSNVNTYSANVVYARIEALDLNNQGAKIEFFFKGGDGAWQAVTPNSLYKFSTSSSELFWRATFQPAGSSFISPYFDRILLHYWVRPRP